MTIAALVRGREGTYNALLVDTGAIGPRGDLADHDKLHRVFGETYVTCVGDGGLLPLLANLIRVSKKRPNLREPRVIVSLFAELELARESGLLLGVPTAFPAAQPCTTLVACNRAEAFFWKVEFDAERGAHVTPAKATFLDADQMVVLRGVTVATLEPFSTVDMASAEEFTVDQMIHVNEQLERDGADPLPYEMKRRVSGILLPHKTTEPAIRIDPGVPPMAIRGLSWRA